MSHSESYQIHIRQARKRDRASILSFTRNTFHWGDYLDQVWDDWLRNPEGRFLVASVGGIAVGIMHVAYLGEREAWFEGMRVHPDYRRHGIAHSFVTHGITLARQNSCRVVRVETGAHNIPAQQALMSMGFRRTLSLREFTSHSLRGSREIIRLAQTSDTNDLYLLWEHSWYNRVSHSLFALDDPWHWGEFTKSRLHSSIVNGRVWVTPPKGKARGFAFATEGDDGIEVSLLAGEPRDLLNGFRCLAGKSGKGKCFLILPDAVRFNKWARGNSFKSDGDGMLIYERFL